MTTTSTMPAPRGVGGRPLPAERDRRVALVCSEIVRARAAVAAADARAAAGHGPDHGPDHGPLERLQSLERRLDRLQGGDAARAGPVAAALAAAGGAEAVAAAIAADLRQNCPTWGKLEQLEAIIRGFRIRLHTHSLGSGPQYHPDQVEAMRRDQAEAEETAARARGKVAAEQAREAARLVASAAAGSAAGVRTLAGQASSSGLGALAAALAPLAGDVRDRGLEADIREFPDD